MMYIGRYVKYDDEQWLVTDSHTFSDKVMLEISRFSNGGVLYKKVVDVDFVWLVEEKDVVFVCGISASWHEGITDFDIRTVNPFLPFSTLDLAKKWLELKYGVTEEDYSVCKQNNLVIFLTPPKHKNVSNCKYLSIVRVSIIQNELEFGELK